MFIPSDARSRPPSFILFSLGLMRRALLIACSAAMLFGCATSITAQSLLADRHIARSITGRSSRFVFQSSSDPLVLVHSADPRSVPCDERSPNRIYDDQRLTRTKIHVERADVT